MSEHEATRLTLIDELERQGEAYPALTLGLLVYRLACLAHVSEYDVEDEQLLLAARSGAGLGWFSEYEEKWQTRSTVRTLGNRPSHRCPCCHKTTLCGRGQFELCPVCYWQDDGQDDTDVDSIRGGVNGNLSLHQARVHYESFNVSDARFKEHVRSPRVEEMFDPAELQRRKERGKDDPGRPLTEVLAELDRSFGLGAAPRGSAE